MWATCARHTPLLNLLPFPFLSQIKFGRIISFFNLEFLIALQLETSHSPFPLCHHPTVAYPLPQFFLFQSSLIECFFSSLNIQSLIPQKFGQFSLAKSLTMATARRSYFIKEMLPFTVMVGLECSNVGLNTLFKAATMEGLSYHVFITYSYSIAALVLLPSHLLYRKTALPPLSFWILGKLFLLSLIGSSSLMLGYRGINYSSPTLASALSNLIPAFTFILAIIFRMERLVWRSSSSQAKILGTLVSISGALIVIFYKGPAILILLNKSPPSLQDSHNPSQANWVLGGLLLSSEYILTPIWYIVQAQIIKEYPAELIVVFFYSLFAAMISGIVGFMTVTNPNAWKLKFDISLAAILYSGLLGSFLGNSIHAWVLHRKGPVYIAMFKPLSIAIAAAMGVMFLGDTLHLGSVIGAAIISLGFYSVMWGKATEEMCKEYETADLESPSDHLKTPLLQSIKEERSVQNGGY